MICKCFIPFHRLPSQFINDLHCTSFKFSIQFIYFFLYFLCLWCCNQNHYQIQGSTNFNLFLKCFILLALTLKSLIHFELIFVYGIRERFNVLLLHGYMLNTVTKAGSLEFLILEDKKSEYHVDCGLFSTVFITARLFFLFLL